MIPYLKIAKAVAPYLIVALISALIVGWAQQVRIKALKLDLASARQDTASCQQANTENQGTITNLKEELKNAYSGCNSRLQLKEKTIQDIRRIDRLAAIREGDNEKGPKSDGGSGGGNPLLDELNRMYVAEADRKD